MKEFAIGMLKLIGASIVFVLPIFLGSIYAVLHAVYMTLTLKKINSIPVLLWRWIDGMFASVGYLAGEIAYSIDLISNVNGEIYEDLLGLPEDSSFGKKNISVSSSTGEQVFLKKYPKKSTWFLKMLNLGFQQKQHALDSWLFDESRIKLIKGFFK